MIELLLAAEDALARGLLDQAERTYRQVLESDPRNGIAAVGLARVALERGDEAGAIRLAQTALGIDPENATARRMIDCHEEVARLRGGEVAGPEGAGPSGSAAPSDGMIRASAAPTPPWGGHPNGSGAHPMARPLEPGAAGGSQAAGLPGTATADASPPAAPPGAAPAAQPPGAARPPGPRPHSTPARSGLLRRLLRRP